MPEWRGNWGNWLEGAVGELKDLAVDLAGRADSGDLDEASLAELEQRMSDWLAILRRNGGQVPRVLARLEEMRRRLADQGNLAERIARLDQAIDRAGKAVRSRAGTITRSRRAAAAALSKEVAARLPGLGFRKARFDIAIDLLPEPGPLGDSACSYLFAPNAGEPPAALNRIASSGETARVMLALKTVLAEIDQTPVLVFDEVDANVGGEIGREVGRELRALGAGRQVVCVTHLPQVASLAHRHFVVTKTQDDASTSVSIAQIDGDRSLREAELARMLGDRDSRSAREHARELLG